MVVYWCDPDLTPHVIEVEESPTQIKDLLEMCAILRENGKIFITSGHFGVGSDIVKDATLPNGLPYTWKKRRL